MKKLLFHLIIFVMTICLFPQVTPAKTGYVSDMLLLTFRQGPANSYAVTQTLKSDTPVVILEEKDGFYKVELQSGDIGWVDKKFIVFESPKAFIINQLTREKEILETKVSTLESAARTLQDKLDSLEASLKTALDEKEKISGSLSDNRKKYNTLIEQSKNIQNIIKENKLLQETNKTISREMEALKGKTEGLFKTGMIKWFLAGAGVLLMGWIIGQTVSSKKRRSGSSLLS